MVVQRALQRDVRTLSSLRLDVLAGRCNIRLAHLVGSSVHVFVCRRDHLTPDTFAPEELAELVKNETHDLVVKLDFPMCACLGDGLGGGWDTDAGVDELAAWHAARRLRAAAANARSGSLPGVRADNLPAEYAAVRVNMFLAGLLEDYAGPLGLPDWALQWACTVAGDLTGLGDPATRLRLEQEQAPTLERILGHKVLAPEVPQAGTQWVFVSHESHHLGTYAPTGVDSVSRGRAAAALMSARRRVQLEGAVVVLLSDEAAGWFPDTLRAYARPADDGQLLALMWAAGAAAVQDGVTADGTGVDVLGLCEAVRVATGG